MQRSVRCAPCALLPCSRDAVWLRTSSRGPVTAADPLPPRADPPLEISAPQPPPTADQDTGVFSPLKRIPDLLRPDPPAPTGETRKSVDQPTITG